MQFSIAELESIINYFRELHPSKDQITLCTQARRLGDVYGTMIHHGLREVTFSALSHQQRSAVAEYLNAHPHLIPQFAGDSDDDANRPGPT